MAGDTEESALVQVLLPDRRLGLRRAVQAEGVTQVDQEVGLAGADVLHGQAVQLVAEEGGEALVRIALHDERERRRPGTLGMKAVLGAGDEVVGRAAGPMPLSVVVPGVRGEPVDDDLDRPAREHGRRRLAGVNTGCRPVLEVRLDGLAGDRVHRHRMVGRAAEQLRGDPGDVGSRQGATDGGLRRFIVRTVFDRSDTPTDRDGDQNSTNKRHVPHIHLHTSATPARADLSLTIVYARATRAGALQPLTVKAIKYARWPTSRWTSSCSRKLSPRGMVACSRVSITERSRCRQGN